MVTDEQVRLLRQNRMAGKRQESSAAKSGMSVRTARKWEAGPLPSSSKEARPWRTREDPFSAAWESEVVPLLQGDRKGKLQAKTILKELRRRHPTRYAKGQLRTLQRRVRDWRALHGPDKDVMFPQEHPPGREGAFDFTHCTSLDVTIGGVAVYEPPVRSWSTVRVGGRAYSVPSRLIGHKLEVRQHPDMLEVFYKGRLVEMMPRLRGGAEVRIDYRHIIGSLVGKSGAFARYRFREELFPSLVFRVAYDALKQWRGERADIEYVRILHLAATTMESVVETALQLLLESGQRFDYAALKELAVPEEISVPQVHIPAPDLLAYDQLLAGAC